ncbi:glycosyltransferase family 2 protein [uncultured Duncaniella sp.]|uniref:glycosyltransferase family 2 protein n=1 Tax=uncultured Duncaniella sp. TaxID=2768039 RepID=UPI0025F9FA82|nr:glycosyltransferase family 2 protein [uncultured Duncaniella sp.]
MDVSIVIVNYNTKLLLKDCLDSIQSKTLGCHYEIIVVDNASKDDSVDMVKCEYPNVILIESNENLGFGRANNLGTKQAKGKYLFYLNSDTVLLNDAVSEFFRFAESAEEKLGALGCILTGPDGNTCHSYGKMITPGYELKTAIARYLRFLKPRWLTMPDKVKKPLSVDYITGADLFVPREVFEKTRGFDPDYFMYCEEVDWQKRMDNLNLKRFIIPGPEIIHLEGGSDTTKTKSWSKSRISNIQKSRRIFYQKHFNKKILPLFLIAQNIIQLPWKLLK